MAASLRGPSVLSLLPLRARPLHFSSGSAIARWFSIRRRMTVAKSDPVVIVGAGAFGLSTALHLNQAGYTNITVLEKDDKCPSRWSAANDLNKIVRAEYEDDFYTNLTLEAICGWRSHIFGPHWHPVGFLHCVSGAAPQRAVDTLSRFRAAAERHPAIAKHVSPMDDPEDIRASYWQFQDGSLPGWKGYLNKMDGYAHSANALRGVYNVCLARGVKFRHGEAGAATSILYDSHQEGERKSTGIQTKSGTCIPAKLVIVAVGAAAARLVPESGRQVVAKAWSVTHIKLTDDETSALRGIPVTYARDLGFFFEPDPKTNLLKLCPMGGGYLNTDINTGISHAPETLHRTIPRHDQEKLRNLLQQTLPSLADRPFVHNSICWFADTSDSDFIIDYVPGTSSSVIMLSGDSGHAFKMFPIAGKWVENLLLASDGQQSIARWRWKASKPADKDDNWGDAVSWRIGETTELRDVMLPVESKL